MCCSLLRMCQRQIEMVSALCRRFSCPVSHCHVFQLKVAFKWLENTILLSVWKLGLPNNSKRDKMHAITTAWHSSQQNSGFFFSTPFLLIAFMWINKSYSIDWDANVCVGWKKMLSACRGVQTIVWLYYRNSMQFLSHDIHCIVRHTIDIRDRDESVVQVHSARLLWLSYSAQFGDIISD